MTSPEDVFSLQRQIIFISSLASRLCVLMCTVDGSRWSVEFGKEADALWTDLTRNVPVEVNLD